MRFFSVRCTRASRWVLLLSWTVPGLFCPEALANERAEARGCVRDSSATVAFVGDLIFQNDLQRIAMAEGSSYRRFWSAVDPIFRAVDAVYGNVEGTLARNVTYRGTPVADPGRSFASDVYSQPPAILNFNYHYSLARDLRESGFRVVSTGNNHALDRGRAGVDQTIEHLQREGIVAVGTRHSRLGQPEWGRVTPIRAMNVGWVACTYGTNGILDVLDQVLDCYEEKEQTLAAIRSLAARSDVSAVFFVPHWGIENQPVVARRQEALAREAIEAGATAVVGTHPHILQEWQWMTSSDGRAAPVVYSTGNFVSAQALEHQREGLVLMMELRRAAPDGKATLASVRYLLSRFDPASGGVSIIAYDAGRHSMLPASAHLAATDLEAMTGSCE